MGTNLSISQNEINDWYDELRNLFRDFRSFEVSFSKSQIVEEQEVYDLLSVASRNRTSALRHFDSAQ